MTHKEIKFIVLATLWLAIPIIAVGIVQPTNNQPELELKPELEFRSEKSKHMDAPYGHPDKFAEYFADVEGINDGYAPYPQGYKMVEFQRAKLASAKRGSITQLDWVERGPGRVGGRTRAILLDPTDPTFNTFYVGSVGGGVWKAQRYVDNTGQVSLEWTPLTDGLPSLSVSAMAGASPKHPDVIYVGTGEGFRNVDAGSGIGMLKTTDRGMTWTHLNSTINNDDWRYVNRIAVDPDNPDIVVVATNTAIFRSDNGGQSFLEVYRNHAESSLLKRRVQDLRATPNDFNIQFAGVNGTGIIRSLDAGKTWNMSFSDLRHNGRRIELAISYSNPEVIWASVEGPSSDELYRSINAGESWTYVENPPSAFEGSDNFLGRQGWYDNAIAVHPFSPDTAFLGGIHRWKAHTTGSGLIKAITRFFNGTSDFLTFDAWGASHALANGRIIVGPYSSEVTSITWDEMTSVEIRFGPGLTQFAHRFILPSNPPSGAIPMSVYLYQDYVEVPFQVWDIDNNRQLMVSFRDTRKNGTWDLSPHSDREYLYISKFDYDDSAPLSDYMTDGGMANGMMYYLFPFQKPGSTWDPNAPTPGTVEIEIREIFGEYRIVSPWNNDQVHVDHHNLTVIPIDSSKNEFHILNGNDGGFAFSRDGGQTWTEGDAFPGYNTAQFYDATKRTGYNMYMGGTQDNGTWASYDNANSKDGWRFVLGGDGFDVIWKGADSLMGSIQYNTIARSIGGSKWAIAGNIQSWPGQFLTSLGWTPESGDVVFSISPRSAGGLLRSLDFGASWHNIPARSDPEWVGGYGGKVRVSLADPEVVWVGYRMNSPSGSGRLYVSTNALNPRFGDTGEEPVRIRPVNTSGLAPRSTITGLATHPLDRATAYVMFSVSCQPKLLRTEDMGDTWEDLSGFAIADVTGGGCLSSNGFPNARVWDVEVFPDAPNIIWAGTDIGIFESRDHGQTWVYADNGLPAASVWRIRIVDSEVVVATHGRGVWSLDISQVQTSVEAIAEVPTEFELLDNYPNPFNPSTTIGFKLARNSHIRVSVFDVMGRKVATLIDQPHSRGTHQITWDASAMSSGQYIYRMEADGKLIGSKAMVLVK